MATRAAANSFFFSVFVFFGKKITKIFGKKKKSKIKKKSPSRHKYSHPAAGQETNFFLRVALGCYTDQCP